MPALRFLERDAKARCLRIAARISGWIAPLLPAILNGLEMPCRAILGMSASGRKSIAELVGHRMKNSLLLACCVTERWRAHGDFPWRYHRSLARQTD